ncbi:helix-turn-helix domain-containing protein [Anaerofustis stercorihominis]|uniref:helix-turn-helix domain-containing protein n=1 Tax=Anaerofustis stercorihominis TaxID=214853 RepID=UPI0014852F43|nr:helix-turn-helix transcriptional regulator [Anaerofustis stercorihominis]
MSKKGISLKLKELRRKNKLTIEKVKYLLEKRDINVAIKTIYGWESGQRLPTPDIFLNLCDIYNVNDILEEFEVGKRKKKVNDNLKMIAREDGISYNSLSKSELKKLKETTVLITEDE